MTVSEVDDCGDAAALAAEGPTETGAGGEANVATASLRPGRRSRSTPWLDRGTVIGRYVIVDPLGRGGMGDVYGAYDPELDRRIALKLVRDLTGDGRARLIAEAQAMARVSHPNVIAVHDAGSFVDGVFIAMEFVEGETLSAWRQQLRTRAEIMAVFDAAGRGLAAAHAAGIVHRDFKPTNVMVGRDGRVRVLDFGLARFGGRSDDTPLPHTGSHEPADDHSPQVMASRVMGTPIYMAPEQRRPGVHDARVDQYGFAVTLYETLYGERPFAGNDAETLAFNANGHRIRPAVRSVDVPVWIRDVLVRALEPDPLDRYPSMAALLGALAHDPAVFRRRVALAVAVAAMSALAAVGLVRMRTSELPPCQGADAPISRTWDDLARDRVVAAFRATGRSYAPAWAARVVADLSRRAAALGASRVATCLATSVRHEQSPALLDLRLACLDRRLGEFDALVDRLGAGPDPALMDHALDAAAALPALETCADADALLTVTPRPTNPTAAPHLAAGEAALAAAAASIYAADLRASRSHADAAVTSADLSGYGPLRAETRLALVRAARRAGDLATAEIAVFEAATFATQDRADRTAAEAWILSIAVLTELGRPREALALVHPATAALARIGRPARLRAELLDRQSLALDATGDEAAAAARQDESIALRTTDPTASDPLGLADALNHRAGLASDLGDHASAEVLHRRSLEMRTARLGNDHPDVASTLNNLGVTLYHSGRLDAAQALYEDALARRLRSLGPDHVDVGTSLNNLGGVYLDRGKLALADEYFTRALANWEHVFGPNHPDLAIPLGNLGDVALQRGEPARALLQCSRAYQLESKAAGPQAPDLAYSLTCEGEAQLALGHLCEARSALECALTLREGSPTDVNELARTRLALATALHRSQGNSSRVHQLAAAARDVLADAGPMWAVRLAAAKSLALDSDARHGRSQQRRQVAEPIRETACLPRCPLMGADPGSSSPPSYRRASEM